MISARSSLPRCLIVLLSLALLAPAAAFSQAASPPGTNVEALLELSARFAEELEARRTPLYYELLARTDPVQGALNADPDIRLMFIAPDGRPVYVQTNNINAARTLGVDDVWPGGSAGYALGGSGTALGELAIWDAGGVRTSHQEFGGRATQMDGASGTHYHATHVAGTMIAAGVDSDAKGMSFQGTLACHDWNNDESEMASAAASGMNVSNHSYGYSSGWSYSSSSGNWYWYGDVEVSEVEEYGFGFYADITREWDEIAYNAPYYTIVKSAGNERDDDGPGPGGGHYYWDPDTNDWEWSTATRNPDGGATGHDCVSWNGNAKNILAIGAVQDIPGGYSSPGDVEISYFSSWGPTDDGRIKPDFAANGISLYSTHNSGNTAYATYSGTSMSAPNTSGTVNLLIRYYEQSHGTTPRASTVKSILMQTADEAGVGNGPDYTFGWGLINARKAVELIQADSSATGRVREETLANGETDEFFFTHPAAGPVCVSIAWTDPPGTPVAPAVDPPDLMLVNDLDLRVERIGGSTYLPYVLDPANPNAAATTGDNIRDNAEQVYVASAPAGTYRVTVAHGGTLRSTQVYSIASSHDLGTGSAPASPVVAASDTSCSHVVVEWSAVAGADSFEVIRDETLLDVVGASVLVYRDTVSAGTYLYEVRAGNEFGWSPPGSDMGTVLAAPLAPASLAASDTSLVLVRLDWSASVGAESYRIYREGAVLATVPAATLSYRDTTSAGTYLYGVAAGNACGFSDSTTALGTVLPPPNWMDIAAGPLAGPDSTLGAAWGDHDGDGDLDLFLANRGSASLLLRNDGGGTFADATPPLLGGSGNGAGAAWGDFDNDGLLDLYAANDGPNALFRGLGGGAFEDATGGPLGDAGDCRSAPWGDFEDDRRLDLFLVNHGTADRLLRNEAPGPFADATIPPLGDAGSGSAASWGDFDNDGDVDLYLTHETAGLSRLYRNEGFGLFADATAGPLAGNAPGAMAVFGDFDNDLDLDLFRVGAGIGTSELLRNDGGTFALVAGGPTNGAPGRSAAWGDVDNDGDLDLYVGCDGPNRLFRNDGGGSFAEIEGEALGDAGDARSVVFGDADNDGDLDLLVANADGPNRLFRNSGAGRANHWVHVTLEGTASNLAAIGARVRLVAGGLAQIREISGGEGSGQGSLAAEFGLGDATVIDTIEITWPSGFVQTLAGFSADAFYLIVEDALSTGIADAPLPRAYRLLPNVPNPFNPATRIFFEAPEGGRVNVSVYDVSGRIVTVLADGFYPAGRHDVAWDGTDAAGEGVPSGVYFARMTGNGFEAVRKLLLLR
ncbi:MAG: FG-GAP-like repeat-containing protein [Candidatus Eisenbacteria bacterium]